MCVYGLHHAKPFLFIPQLFSTTTLRAGITKPVCRQGSWETQRYTSFGLAEEWKGEVATWDQVKEVKENSESWAELGYLNWGLAPVCPAVPLASALIIPGEGVHKWSDWGRVEGQAWLIAEEFRCWWESSWSYHVWSPGWEKTMKTEWGGETGKIGTVHSCRSLLEVKRISLVGKWKSTKNRKSWYSMRVRFWSWKFQKRRYTQRWQSQSYVHGHVLWGCDWGSGDKEKKEPLGLVFGDNGVTWQYVRFGAKANSNLIFSSCGWENKQPPWRGPLAGIWWIQNQDVVTC